MQKFTAKFVFDGFGVHTDTCLVLDDAGTVRDLVPAAEHPDAREYAGMLCPGFVNAHCHLELSHLASLYKGIAHGMIPFAQAVMQSRDGFAEDTQRAAALDAMNGMYATGTQAVGDICNGSLTATVKHDHALYTHSYIELTGAVEARMANALAHGQQLMSAFEGLTHSLVPHAPYSVSAPLAQAIASHSESNQLPWCMHFMESAEEAEWLRSALGPMREFLAPFGVTSPPATSHILYLAAALPQTESPAMLVHCTQLNRSDIREIYTPNPQVIFCLCPRSNRILHNQEPDYNAFPWDDSRVCLGTDSLASNSDLNVFQELKHIGQRVPLSLLLRALTSTGARAIGASQVGIFQKGKKPGVVQITDVVGQQNRPESLRLTPTSQAIRVI